MRSQGVNALVERKTRGPELPLVPVPKSKVRPDDNLSRGAEFAGVITVFFLIGLALDLWLETTPWFMIGMFTFSVVGQFVKLWYTYDANMKVLEAERNAMSASSHKAKCS